MTTAGLGFFHYCLKNIEPIDPHLIEVTKKYVSDMKLNGYIEFYRFLLILKMTTRLTLRSSM